MPITPTVKIKTRKKSTMDHLADLSDQSEVELDFNKVEITDPKYNPDDYDSLVSFCVNSTPTHSKPSLPISGK